MSSLGPGHLQVLGQRRELVALCPVVVVAGQGLGLPGVHQVHHVHGQVVLRVAARGLPPVLMLALQLAHPPAVLEPGVVADASGPNQLPSLLCKVVSVEKLQGKASRSGAGMQPAEIPSACFHCRTQKNHLFLRWEVMIARETTVRLAREHASSPRDGQSKHPSILPF